VPGDGPRTLADLIAFNEANRGDEMPFFGQDIFDDAVEKGPLTEPAYLEALATCGRLSPGTRDSMRSSPSTDWTHSSLPRGDLRG
jgi:hypothetical protein